MGDKGFDGRREISYLSRYGGSGVLNTLIGFLVIFSAMGVGFSPVVSNVAGYAVGFLMGFVLSKKFVFRTNDGIAGESVRYLIAFAIAFSVNLLVLHLMLNHFHFNAIFSQIIAASSYTILMYILSRAFVFNVANRCGNKTLPW